MKFPYLKFPANPNPAFPDHKQAKRPVLPIEVSHNNRSVRYFALIDSGADFCIFHASVAEYLNIDTRQGKKLEYFGIEGNKQEAFFHNVDLCFVGGQKFTAYVGFSFDFNTNMPYGVLGQREFFEKYKIIFDYSSSDIEIREKVQK